MKKHTHPDGARNTILSVLLEHTGRYVPGDVLTGSSGLSRAGVWKYIESLRKQGFSVRAAVRKGYCLEDVPDRLYPQLVTSGLGTKTVAQEVFYYNRADSTNRIAKDLARRGVPDGSLVLAEEQTGGKGRLQRSWLSPPHRSILGTFVFYPQIPMSAVFRLTMLVSVAVVRAIAAECGIEAGIKWPNDVYVNGKKVCGVLTEFLGDHDSIAYVVVGVGINVNFDPGQNPEIRDTATSLSAECGRSVSRLRVLQALLKEIDRLYTGGCAASGSEIQDAWQRCSLVLNRRVAIVSGDECTRGTVTGFTPEGHLVLRDKQGRMHEIACGDVSLRM